MLVTIQSECQMAARSTSAAILDRYLPRVGRRTWHGAISSEGLDNIRRKLAAKASARMAICCRRHRGNHHSDVVWFVGSRKSFGPDGTVAVHVSERLLAAPDHIVSPQYLLLGRCVELAGLLHDVGKATEHFSKKLQSNKPIADFVRHELLSVYVLEELVGDRSDLAWLGELAVAPASVMAVAIQKAFSRVAGLFGCQDSPSDAVLNLRVDGRPVYHAVRWLIMSHHRLPHADVGPSGNVIVNSQAYITWRADDKKTIPDYRTAKLRLLTDEADWIAKLTSSADRCRLALSDCDSAVIARGLPGLRGFGRVAVMLADHHVSKNKKPASDPADGRLYANSVSVETAVGTLPRVSGQHLETHLRSVAKLGLSSIRGFARASAIAPRIPESEVPQTLSDPHPAHGTRFAWQAASARAVRQADVKYGFFGIVLAGTGNGKTLGNAIILAALSPELRYTVGLGLRTLTLQTGDAYKGSIGLIEGRHLATRIGSLVVQRLHEESSGNTGSESSDESDELDIVLGETTDYDQPLRGTLKTFSTSGTEEFLRAPVLVTTVDGIMTIADGHSGARLHPALRMMTSDLVLDEIDDYAERDQAALMRLAEAIGNYGRRLIISSATLPPPTAEGMFLAYRRGYSEYAAMTGEPDQVDVGWFPDEPTLVRVEGNVTIERFAGLHLNLVRRIVSADTSRPARRRVELLSVSPVATLRDIHKCILDGCRELHRRYHVVEPQSGRRISLGFVRCGNVEPARELARYLAETATPSDAIEHRVVCYHSRHLVCTRHYIETFLDRACTRKLGSSGLFKDPSVVRALSETQGDLMIIVVSTSIEEVGRDHDFDWLIADPSGNRQVVQAAGRVHRHRDIHLFMPNVMVLDRPLRWHRNRWDGRQDWPNFGLPGVEEFRKPEGSGQNAWRLASERTAEVFDIEAMVDRLDARHCLVTPEANVCEIAAMEHKKLRSFLIESDSHTAAWDAMRNHEDLLTNRMLREHRFRAASPERDFVRLRLAADDEWHWKFREPGFSNKNKWNIADIIVTELEIKGRYLLDIETERQFEALAKRIMPDHIYSAACYALLTLSVPERKAYPQIEFSEQLGAING